MAYMYTLIIHVGIKPWYIVPFVINNSFLKDFFKCDFKMMALHEGSVLRSVFVVSLGGVCMFSPCLCGFSPDM